MLGLTFVVIMRLSILAARTLTSNILRTVHAKEGVIRMLYNTNGGDRRIPYSVQRAGSGILRACSAIKVFVVCDFH